MLPDRDAALAATRDVNETYMRSGFGPGMAKFIAVVSQDGPIPADSLTSPLPTPPCSGFLGGEYGQVGDLDAFASTLRKVLAAEA